LEVGRPDLQRIRFEARCQAWAESVGRISSVRDLTAEKVIGLLQNRWDWSVAGATMANTTGVVDAVISMGLNATLTRTLVGDAVIRSAGREVLVADGTRQARDRRLRDLDHVISRSNPYPFGSRLDLVTGCEVPVWPRDNEETQ
jgi:hypothetical protein